MDYSLLCFIVCLVSVFGKHCQKLCTSDSDCDNEHYCTTDVEACDFWCALRRQDLPPPVIGRRSTECSQLPMICPQQCIVTRGGCTICDCAQATGSGSGSSAGQNSPFNAGFLFGNPIQMSQSVQGNPGNMGQSYPGGYTGPKNPLGMLDPSKAGFNFNPGNPGGSFLSGTNVQTQNGGSSGTHLDQIVTPIDQSTITTLPTTTSTTTTTIHGTCAPVRCIAPCNKGVTIGADGCPKCLCN